MEILVPLEEIRREEKRKATAAKAPIDAALVHPPGEPMPNARMFLGHEYGHADRCLLIQQGGQFYHWDGTCWPAIEDPMLKSELYQWFEEKRYQCGDKEMPFAPTARKVADLMEATRAITIIETTTPTPSWLSHGDHLADEVISCENGLVHWPTRTLHGHRPGYYVHHSVPFAFDPKAPSLRGGSHSWASFGAMTMRLSAPCKRCLAISLPAIPDSRKYSSWSAPSVAVRAPSPACSPA